MQCKLFDRYDIDDAAKVRITNDGYLTANPRVARTGIQLYLGKEVGVADMKVVRIYRSPDEVFKTDSLATYAHRPVTDDHPAVPVDSKNWRTYSRGQTGDEIARDGDFIRVPMVLMDAGLIGKVRDGKAEISQGYTCDIEMTPGTTPEGETYDGFQKNIRINHTAIVDAGRAGSKARIGDGSGEIRTNFSDYAAAFAALSDGKANVSNDALANPDGFLGKGGKYPIAKDGTVYVAALRAAATDSVVKGDGDITAAALTLLSLVDASDKPAQQDAAPQLETKAMKTIMVDGINVAVGDGNDGEIIQRHIKTLGDNLATAVADAATAKATATAAITAKDGEIVKLTTDLATTTAKVTDLEAKLKDAEITPAKVDAMLADRKIVSDKAKVLLPTVTVDGKTDSEIRRQVVDAKVGDAAKGWSDEFVKVSFDSLAVAVKVPDAGSTMSRPGGLRDQATALATTQSTSDAQAAREKAHTERAQRTADAWKTPGGVRAN